MGKNSGTIVFSTGIFAEGRLEVHMDDLDQNESFSVNEGLQINVTKVGDDEYSGVVYPEWNGKVNFDYPICEVRGLRLDSDLYLRELKEDAEKVARILGESIGTDSDDYFLRKFSSKYRPS